MALVPGPVPSSGTANTSLPVVSAPGSVPKVPEKGAAGFVQQHSRAAEAASAETGIPAQFMLAQAALEVSRLEERIRYVVESRRRAQQRLADLQAQVGQWQQRRDDAAAELDTIAEQIASAEEQAEILAAQAED